MSRHWIAAELRVAYESRTHEEEISSPQLVERSTVKIKGAAGSRTERKIPDGHGIKVRPCFATVYAVDAIAVLPSLQVYSEHKLADPSRSLRAAPGKRVAFILRAVFIIETRDEREPIAFRLLYNRECKWCPYPLAARLLARSTSCRRKMLSGPGESAGT